MRRQGGDVCYILYKKHFMPNYSDEGNYTFTMHAHMSTSSYCDKVLTSLQKQPFLLAPRRWGSSAKRNVCDSATEILLMTMVLPGSCLMHKYLQWLLLEGENHYHLPICVS